MKRNKSVEWISGVRRRRKLSILLASAVSVYLFFIALKFRRLLDLAGAEAAADLRPQVFESLPHQQTLEDSSRMSLAAVADPMIHLARPEDSLGGGRYGRITGEILKRHRGGRKRGGNFSELERMASEAWQLGLKAWEEIEGLEVGGDLANVDAVVEERTESCPSSISKLGDEIRREKDGVLFLPCGLRVGSAVTVVGTPENAHEERVLKVGRLKEGDDGIVQVSQFVVELMGLRAVDGEDAPKILHLNPRLKGDWSGKMILEHNTCFRMQWGKAMRCDGVASKDEDDTVDGFRKCEKWQHDDSADSSDSKESKTFSWLKRFIGRAKKPEMTWPFPFTESKLFVLTIQAGVEGFHIYVGGRHISSFPYRPGFTLEDATGLAVKGDLQVHSVYATSLPTSHPSFSLQKILEMSERWKSPPLPNYPIQLFIGILSATNHFAERMAIRKTWMQYPDLQTSKVVARFFVALGSRKEVNAAMKKEAEYFNDIVILPFMDRYELVVLKTIAICEHGIHNVTAAYVMKCDDDTFVRVDVISKLINAMAPNKSLYVGNLNLLHRPLRSGKWAVTYEEWPELIYPPYANGPGYIISSDIAQYVVSQHRNQSLRLFKMEDVSMGMWVEEFNATTSVQYSHSWRFCQYGCMENYFTAHYQSPRQMLCLWDKLSHGQAQCCSYR